MSRARKKPAQPSIAEEPGEPMESAAPSPVVIDGGRHATIGIGYVVHSPHNPRKYFDDASLHELAESIKQHGIIEPLIVRVDPLFKGASPDDSIVYELVAGERRHRAAVMAGVTDLPVIIRELTDQQAAEVSLIENLQRKDLNALEEAAGLKRLVDLGNTIDEAAAKIGKSRRHVYARIQLLSLDDSVQESLAKGKIKPSTAVLLAGVPQKLQKKALQDTARLGGSVREIGDHLRHQFTRSLKGDLPFDPDDETLGEFGACGPCPFRSGNDPDLAIAYGQDVCTSPANWLLKAEQTWERMVASAEAAGNRVLSKEETEKAYNQYSNLKRGRDGYYDIDADGINVGNDWKKYSQILGKHAKPILLTRVKARMGSDDTYTRVVRLVEAKALPDMLRAVGHENIAKTLEKDMAPTKRLVDHGARATQAVSTAMQKQSAEIVRRVRLEMAEALIEKAVAAKVPESKVFRILTKDLFDNSDSLAIAAGLQALGVKLPDDVEDAEQVDKVLARLSGPQLVALTLYVLIEEGYDPHRSETAKLVKWNPAVEEKKIEARVTAAVKAEEKAAASEAKSKQLAKKLPNTAAAAAKLKAKRK